MANSFMNDGFTDFSKLVSDAIERIRIKMDNPKAITGIATCFPSLDYYTSGLQRGDLIVVAGRPSMGKRIFVRNIAMGIASKNALPVAILESAMSGVMMATHMLASIAKIDRHDLLAGKIGDDETERLESAVDVLKKVSIHFSTVTSLSVHELGDQLRKLNNRTGELGLIVVDCLPELKLSDENMNGDDVAKIANISRFLKVLAKELNVPIIVISRIERDLEERYNKWPRLTDLPGMGAIANAADLVLMIYRDEVYDPESEEKGTARIIVSKNMDGSIGSFSLKFDERCGAFEEIIHGF